MEMRTHLTNSPKITGGSVDGQVAVLTQEIRGLTRLLKDHIAEEGKGNPTSVKCTAVLDKPAKCFDFSGTRRYAACRAWDLIEVEGVSWSEALKRAWDEVKKTCVWE